MVHEKIIFKNICIIYYYKLHNYLKTYFSHSYY